MEQQYQKTIHYTSTLIMNHQYERASNILGLMRENGFKNSEIFVMQSYCIKMTKGTNSAITFLRSTFQEGPLVNFTLFQFYKELNEMKNCQKRLKQISDSQDKMGQKYSLIQQISKNLDILLSNDERPPFYEGRYGQVDIEAIKETNVIVQEYKQRRINQKEVKLKLLTILDSRSVVGKLKQQILKFVKYLEYQIKEKQRIINAQN